MPITSMCLAGKRKKEVFEKIAEQFNTKTSGRLVTGEQCMRKWGKITSNQKEIKDQNKKTCNNEKSRKFYDELSECLAKDATINPVITMESARRGVGRSESSWLCQPTSIRWRVVLRVSGVYKDKRFVR